MNCSRHQFAYPVRWIETQDVLLGEQKVERIIEIGPANTLTAMTRKTLDAKYRDHDTALSINRQLLCCKTAENEIYYDLGSAQDAQKESVAPVAIISTETIVTVTSVSAAPQSVGAQSGIALPDVPVTATEVLLTLVAKSLQKGTADIPRSSTIKIVVGGLFSESIRIICHC